MTDRVKTVIYEKNGVELEDREELALDADKLFYDNTISSLLSDNLQESVDELKSILDSLPDEMPALQVQFTTLDTILPSTPTSFIFDNTDIETQSQVLDLNPSNNAEIRLKESGVYLCGYSFSAFETGNPTPAQSQVISNGTTPVLGSVFVCEGEAGNGNSQLELSFNFTRTFLYQANSNDTLQLQASSVAGNYSTETQVNFFVIKLDAQFANFVFNSGSSDVSRANLVLGGVSELVAVNNQTITGNSRTIINWNSQELIDTNCNTHTVGSSDITFQKAGYYKVHSKLCFVLTAGARVRLQATWQLSQGGPFTDIDKSVAFDYVRSTSSADDGSANSMFTIQVNVGDSMRLVAENQSSGFNCQTLGDNSNVIIEYIGDTV